jgi:hypothetical protein
MTFLFSKTERYILNLLKESKKARRIKFPRKRYLVMMAFVFVLALSLIVSFSGMAILSEVNAGKLVSIQNDFSEIPPGTVLDARTLSIELYGHSSNAESYFQQLLSAYNDSADQDLLIIFNPGGWGTKSLDDSSDWMSIMIGMQAKLVQAGYRVVTWNFQRTTDSVSGRLNELKEVVSGYYSKADDLAKRVEFLTDHNMGLRVILAGESTGTMICDSAMNLLKENERVYSIQTGLPFWQKNTIRERTLVVNDNGVVPDSFSKGDFPAMVRSNLKMLLGDTRTEGEGKILNVFSAPGHEYWWQNPGVCNQIGLFLEKYFGTQSQLKEVK